MTEKETIALMCEIKKLKPHYFDKFTKKDKWKMVWKWQEYFTGIDYPVVKDRLIKTILKNDKVPKPSELNLKPKYDVPDWYNDTGEKQASDELMRKVTKQQQMLREKQKQYDEGHKQNDS